MKYLIIIIAILMVSCKKETANRPAQVHTDTTAYFRFTDKPEEYYCISRTEPSQVYPGKINVTINSIPTGKDSIIIYNMPQGESGTSNFINYMNFDHRFNSTYAEAKIGYYYYYTVLGGWIKKTGLFSYEFSFKFDELSHNIVGYGSY